MNGLFLCGYGCRAWIWEKVKKNFCNTKDNIKFVEWPAELTSSFNNLSDFSTWVKDNFINEYEKYDFIIGHSMGGIVALMLSTMEKVDVKQIVLVESYLTSVPKFFQNILMEDSNYVLKEKVMRMLKQECKNYSYKLGNKIKNLDSTSLIEKSQSKIHCIYGDRGSKRKEIVLNELELAADIKKHINIEIVSNSCHFPMLENSEEMVKVLNNILWK